MQVVCYGEVLWDAFKDEMRPGGAPMNVALHLVKYGVSTALISSVGKDQQGKALLDFLRSQQIPTSFVQEHKNLATGIVEVKLDKTRQATYNIIKPVAWDEIQFSEGLASLVREAEVFVFGSLACRSITSRDTLIRLLPEARLKVLDMNLRPPHFDSETLSLLLNACDILKINEDELNYLRDLLQLSGSNEKELLSNLGDKMPEKIICLTLGGSGAMLIDRKRLYVNKGYPVNVADTVGAGDAFLAAVIASLLEKKDMEDSLARACAAGALVASKSGANPDYSSEEIDQLISSHVK